MPGSGSGEIPGGDLTSRVGVVSGSRYTTSVISTAMLCMWNVLSSSWRRIIRGTADIQLRVRFVKGLLCWSDSLEGPTRTMIMQNTMEMMGDICERESV